MATFDLGRVTPLYKGDYSASASYELNDVVLYNGNLYWHVQATATVGILPTDTTVWKLAFADEGVRAEIRGYADDAQTSKTAAATSASNASASASQASASASQAALSATSAQTAETGATASAQTANTKASEATVSAQSAASSAQTATDKATLASQKAAAASESASLATSKANAAATSETNAAASAQTASAKASEAAVSATSAQEYDESAQQSAVNAQTAQGLAETARTGAETAQGLAEDARDEAQQIKDDVEDAIAGKADSAEIGDLSQLTTTAKDNLVSAINEENEVIAGTNERLARQQKFIYSSADEITSIADKKIAIADGKITFVENTGPNKDYWKTLIAPINCLYIDGKATLKSGGLAGGESVNVPTMAFVDDDYNVVGTPVYTAISAPRTFSEADVPEGATYLVGCYFKHFVFAFKSVDSQIKENESKIDGINNTLFVAGKTKVETAFVDATGFYNRTGGFETYSGIKTSTITVDPGEVFSLTSKNYFSMARAVFFDANNTFVSAVHTSGGSALVEDTKIIVPQNAATMLIQAYDTAPVRLYKVDLSEKLTVLSNEVEVVTDAATIQSGTPVALTYEDATGYYAKNKGFATYSGVTVAKVPVTEGQKYLLTTRNYYDAAIALFLDSNESILKAFWVASNTSEVQNYEIIIPGGVSTLMIQRVYKYRPITLTLVTGVSSKPVKSILEGKRITLIGDSITESNSTALTNWAYWIKDWANPTIQNLGASGTGFIAGTNNPYHNRISRIDNPDIIGVALSFNDMSQTIDDLTTAAETFFDDLITAYPTIPVICYVQSPWSAYHPGIEKSDQWVAAMRSICAVRGIPFYDGMYYGSALRPWLAANRAVYYMHDGEGSDGAEDWVHPNSEGHKIIARHLYPHFAENIVATGLDYLI